MTMLTHPVLVVADPDPHRVLRFTATMPTTWRCVSISGLMDTYAMVRRDLPALLLLTLEQPDGDGMALLPHLREDPSLRDLIIVCVSSRNAVQDKVTAFQMGADDYLVTPVDLALFPIRLRLLLRIGTTHRMRHHEPVGPGGQA